MVETKKEKNNKKGFNFYDFRLKANLWLVTHKLLLKKIFAGFLAGLSILLYSYSFFTAANVLIFQRESYNQLLADLGSGKNDYSFFHEALKPLPVQISETNILNSTNNRKDIIAIISNNNSNFIIKELKYQFVGKDGVIASDVTYVWPESEMPLVAFSVKGVNEDDAISLNVLDISWQRIKNKEEFRNFFNQRFRFVFKDIKFIPAGFSNIQGKLPISRAMFTVKNESIFDFWDVGFYIILHNNTNIVGAHYVKIGQFKSFEEKGLEAAWFNALPNVSRVEIIPDVNVLNEDVYIKKSMTTSERK